MSGVPMLNGRWRESPPSIKYRQVTRCKSENPVPIVAVSKEPRTPDDPSKASGDRLLPGASTSGDQPRKVLQSDVPSQEVSRHRVTDCISQVSGHRKTGCI